MLSKVRKYKDEGDGGGGGGGGNGGDGGAPKTYTQEEVDAINAELAKERQEKERLASEVKPDWRKAREKMDRMESILKEKGISIDGDSDDGDGGKSAPVDVEAVRTEAANAGQNAANTALVEARYEDLVDGFSSDDKKLIRHYFDKLSNGEKLSTKNVKDFVEQAVRASGVKSDSGSGVLGAFASRGGAPRSQGDPSPALSETDAANIGGAMGLRFVRNAKK